MVGGVPGLSLLVSTMCPWPLPEVKVPVRGPSRSEPAQVSGDDACAFLGSSISRNNRRAERDMRSPRGVASPIASSADRMKAAHAEGVLARRTHRSRNHPRSRTPRGYPPPICPRLRTNLFPRRSRTRGKPGNSPQHRHHSEDRRRYPDAFYVSQQLPQNFTAKVEHQHDSCWAGVQAAPGSLARGLPNAVLVIALIGRYLRRSTGPHSGHERWRRGNTSWAAAQGARRGPG